jgi:hypothetical protein
MPSLPVSDDFTWTSFLYGGLFPNGSSNTWINSVNSGSATPTLLPTATPPPLEAIPPNCAPGPTLHQIFSTIGPGIGTTPLWIFGFGGTHPELRIDPQDKYVAPYGWIWKIIWEVGPHFSSNITLRGKNVRTGAPIWFHLDGPIVSSAALDPQHPDHPVPAAGEGYAEWGSYVFILAAGCYQMEATWPGGQWSFPFAAGRQ